MSAAPVMCDESTDRTIEVLFTSALIATAAMTPERGEARMTTVEALVQGYYGRSDLLQRIEARLRKAGVDPQKPGFRDLHPFDQLHGLGILATEEHAARASVRAGMQVLDLGSGLGGSSRYLAAVCGCRVSAIANALVAGAGAARGRWTLGTRGRLGIARRGHPLREVAVRAS